MSHPHPPQDLWLLLGHHLDAWQAASPIGMPLDDLRRHATILGSTGSGKSTFLRNIALQAYAHGATVVVIEPHGDLILHPQEGLLAALPPTHLPAVTVLDLASPQPPQINLVTAALSGGRAVGVETTMQAIRAQEPANWEGAARMREIIEKGLHLLLDAHGEATSLWHLQRFLQDAAVQSADTLLPPTSFHVRDVHQWWERRLDEWRNPKQRETLANILEVPQRRVGGFLDHPALRHTLALPPLVLEQTLDLATLLNHPTPQLLLVPLQASTLGPMATRVVGVLLMQLLVQAILARATLPPEARRPVLLILDEFATFAPGEMGELVATLLAQARKFGVGVLLGTQFLAQLPPAIRQELAGNTHTKIVLQLTGEADARQAVALLGTDAIRSTDVMNAQRFCGYGRTSVYGQPLRPFYFQALPPFQTSWAGVRLPPPLPEVPALSPSQAQALHTLHLQLASGGPDGATLFLRDLSAPAFRATLSAQYLAQQHAARALLAQPDQEPDPVQRALRVSRLLWGLDRWIREAQFQRLLAG